MTDGKNLARRRGKNLTITGGKRTRNDGLKTDGYPKEDHPSSPNVELTPSPSPLAQMILICEPSVIARSVATRQSRSLNRMPKSVNELLNLYIFVKNSLSDSFFILRKSRTVLAFSNIP